MADCGDLEKLPPEIRNEIYALALVQAEPFALCNFDGDQKRLGESAGRGRNAPKMNKEWARSDKAKVAPVGHRRNRKARGYTGVGSKYVEVPSNVALTRVNKQLNVETSSVLYGFNFFNFKTTCALERFLKQIGNNKQHLRTVGLSYHPYTSTPRAIEPWSLFGRLRAFTR